MTLKTACYAACLDYVQLRLDAARAGMQAAQESSNSETKSSAGDKYETGRAMAQQERDRHASQFHEATQLLSAMQKLNPESVNTTVRPGALVVTNLGLLYFSIGAGKLTNLEGQEFMAISPAAPIAVALHNKQVGEVVVFNTNQIRVESILWIVGISFLFD